MTELGILIISLIIVFVANRYGQQIIAWAQRPRPRQPETTFDRLAGTVTGSEETEWARRIFEALHDWRMSNGMQVPSAIRMHITDYKDMLEQRETDRRFTTPAVLPAKIGFVMAGRTVMLIPDRSVAQGTLEIVR